MISETYPESSAWIKLEFKLARTSGWQRFALEFERDPVKAGTNFSKLSP